jgi:hypothetical protein
MVIPGQDLGVMNYRLHNGCYRVMLRCAAQKKIVDLEWPLVAAHHAGRAMRDLLNFE